MIKITLLTYSQQGLTRLGCAHPGLVDAVRGGSLIAKLTFNFLLEGSE
jgi:hypothetical protein